MNALKIILRLSVIFTALTDVRGDGCNNIQTYEHPVINMCEALNVTLGRVLISITTTNMGSSTSCSCTLRARTPGLETSTTFVLTNVESNVSRCNESLIKITSPERIDITCASPDEITFYTGQTTNDFAISLSRNDTSVGVSYCLFLLPVMASANGLELICLSNQPPVTTTSSTTTTPSTSRSSPQSSTSSSPVVPLLSSLAVQSTLTTSNSKSDVLADPTITVSSDNGVRLGQDFPTAAVVGGLVGSIALICLTVVVSVYIRYRYKAQQPSPQQPGADNSAYSSLSDVTRVNLRADPSYAVIQSERASSQPGGSDATTTTGVYETVNGTSSATRPDNNVNNDNPGTGTYYNV